MRTVTGKNVSQPGWRGGVDVKPIAGTELCRYHHLGVTVSGRLHVVPEDGTEGEFGAYTAFEIPPGAWVVGDEPWVALDFAGMSACARLAVATGDRILTMILFPDIVDPASRAMELGDAGWRKLLSRHNEAARWEIDRFHGREIDTTADGFL